LYSCTYARYPVTVRCHHTSIIISNYPSNFWRTSCHIIYDALEYVWECVCVFVSACVWERKWERDRQREREKEGERETDRERRVCERVCLCCVLACKRARACVYRRIFIYDSKTRHVPDVYKVPFLYFTRTNVVLNGWRGHLKGGWSEGILPKYLLGLKHIRERRKNVVLYVYTNIKHTYTTDRIQNINTHNIVRHDIQYLHIII